MKTKNFILQMWCMAIFVFGEECVGNDFESLKAMLQLRFESHKYVEIIAEGTETTPQGSLPCDTVTPAVELKTKAYYKLILDLHEQRHVQEVSELTKFCDFANAPSATLYYCDNQNLYHVRTPQSNSPVSAGYEWYNQISSHVTIMNLNRNQGWQVGASDAYCPVYFPMGIIPIHGYSANKNFSNYDFAALQAETRFLENGLCLFKAHTKIGPHTFRTEITFDLLNKRGAVNQYSLFSNDILTESYIITHDDLGDYPIAWQAIFNASTNERIRSVAIDSIKYKSISQPHDDAFRPQYNEKTFVEDRTQNKKFRVTQQGNVPVISNLEKEKLVQRESFLSGQFLYAALTLTLIVLVIFTLFYKKMKRRTI